MWPKTKLRDKLNVAKYLVDDSVEQGRGDRIAYHFHTDDEQKCKKITYKELSELTNRVGNALRTIGVERENRVMILQNDSIKAVANLLGSIKIGAIPFAANTMDEPEKYKYLLQDSSAYAAVVDEDYLPKIESQAKPLRKLVVVGESKNNLSYDRLIRNTSPELEVADTARDSVAIFQYTSGTTGDPKGVMHTHGGIIYSTDTYFSRVLNLCEDDICFSVSKIFFGFGQGNSIWGPLRWGASVLLYPGMARPEKVFQLVERYGVTVLFAAPTHYRKMVQPESKLETYDLSHLRLCVSAGEALPPIVYRQWKAQTGIELLDGLGSTEAFHIFISNRSGQVKPGSSGVPVPGYEAKVVDKDGDRVPLGEVGNLLAKGGSVAIGYWNKYEKTKDTFKGWWLSTGDIYVKDEEGYYTYQGRADDMIRSGGVWVSPIEVEDTLMEHPAVIDAAAIPGRTKEGLLRVKAFVVLDESYEPSDDLEEKLKSFVKSKIAAYKKPTWIEFAKELPRTSTGKIMRHKLRENEENRFRQLQEKNSRVASADA